MTAGGSEKRHLEMGMVSFLFGHVDVILYIYTICLFNIAMENEKMAHL